MPQGEVSLMPVIAVMNIAMTLFVVAVAALVGYSTCQQD